MRQNHPISAPIAFLAALSLQALVWFVWYPWMGYSDPTRWIAQLAFVLLAFAFILIFRLGVRQLGLGARKFLQGLLAILGAYVLLLGLLLFTNAVGGEMQILRQRYQALAILDNWLLTGLGEELLFAGVLFNLVASRQKKTKLWLVVLITASAFALWHLPGYLAIASKMGQGGMGIPFDLLLNFVSWCFFGSMYALSGNLWLTALAHASTDYALLTAVTNVPLLGLLFMFTLVAMAWRLGARQRYAQKGAA